MKNVGVIGCGNISNAYFHAAKNFFSNSIRITTVADINEDAARAKAEEWGMAPVSPDRLLASPDVDIVLNLTTPGAHAEINTKALQAGKHVYCEKPFALDRESGMKVLRIAAEKGLRTGCAPDTFLGGGHQTCRKLIDDGMIGHVVGGTAFMLCHGHESWHPNPGFYYKAGGGPLFDMGPYYLTALVNMLGPVRRVAAFSTRSTDMRTGVKVNAGKTFPVEIDTHVAGTLEFVSGAVITLIMSFDVWGNTGMRDIELFGTKGTLHVPDPNCFNGSIRLLQGGLTSSFAEADNSFIYNDNSRSIGLADMAAAIESGRPHRVSGELAYHILDVMCSLTDSAEQGCVVEVKSTCGRPDPLSIGLKSGELA